jgi:cytochrome c oxidase subunit 2
MTRRGFTTLGFTFGAATVLGGCSGPQSVFDASGAEAQEIMPLFWTVTGIAVAVTVLVITVSAIAVFAPVHWRRHLTSEKFVVAFGIFLPVFVLSGLLTYGLLVMQAGSARSRSAEGPGITIIGEQWWWRVIYDGPEGEEIVSANELRLPVGRPVAIRLQSDNVIHSFWAPQLGGKLDMIPGRTNTLTVEAIEPGISRAQCAEYCGGAHALMSMYVVAMEPDDYRQWLEAEVNPATKPADAVRREGQRLFMAHGCGGCHAVRGTPAAGTIGPDLTHVGSRHSLAAARLPNDPQSFRRWLTDNQHIKPDNFMPEYDVFSDSELDAIAAYLDGLE